MHTPSCSEVYGKCSVTGDRIATMRWWMASDSFMCVYLCTCGNTCCCANSWREKLYISISWHNCCNLKFVDKLFIHEFFKLCCTFLSHLAYCIFRYITDHSLMEIITELHKKKKTTQYFSPICQESLELILKTWHIISLSIYIHIYPFQFFANFLYII